MSDRVQKELNAILGIVRTRKGLTYIDEMIKLGILYRVGNKMTGEEGDVIGISYEFGKRFVKLRNTAYYHVDISARKTLDAEELHDTALVAAIVSFFPNRCADSPIQVKKAEIMFGLLKTLEKQYYRMTGKRNW